MLAETTKNDLPSFIKFLATEQSMSLTVWTDDILDEGVYTLKLIETSESSEKEARTIVRLSVTGQGSASAVAKSVLKKADEFLAPYLLLRQ